MCALLSLWRAAFLGKNMNIAIDVFFVLFLALMFFIGYKKGFLNKAWWLIDVALIVVIGLAVVPTVHRALSENTSLVGKLENLFTSLIGNATIAKLDAAGLASLVTDILIWIVLAIVIIILMAIVKHILKKLRNYSFFKVVDGILGGLYGVIISVAVLMAIGVIVETFTCFAPVQSAHDICSETYVFKYIFGANPFGEYANAHFPVGSWIRSLLQ